MEAMDVWSYFEDEEGFRRGVEMRLDCGELGKDEGRELENGQGGDYNSRYPLRLSPWWQSSVGQSLY